MESARYPAARVTPRITLSNDDRTTYSHSLTSPSGLGVGASSLIIPVYISESSPPAIRGRLIGIFEILLQFSQIPGFWVNYGVNQNISGTICCVHPGNLPVLNAARAFPDTSPMVEGLRELRQCRCTCGMLLVLSNICGSS